MSDLRNTVAAMREAQKAYFRTRSREALIESKRLETLVDKLLAGTPEPDAKAAFLCAFIAGLREYAWWKDGVQYVGTCGTTLQQAIDRAKREAGQHL